MCGGPSPVPPQAPRSRLHAGPVGEATVGKELGELYKARVREVPVLGPHTPAGPGPCPIVPVSRPGHLQPSHTRVTASWARPHAHAGSLSPRWPRQGARPKPSVP